MLVVVVLLVGGFFLFVKKSSTTNTPPVTETAPTSPVSPTGTTQGQMTKEVTVTANTQGFEPQKVTVKVGTKVTWVNKSGGVSNVSSAKHPTHLVYPPLNLGNFQDGATVSLVFDKPGDYKYHNHLEPTQFGSVVVTE